MNKSNLNLSFEFFPPKTEAGREKLIVVRDELSKLQPEFFSVTYGAGGSTRDHTKSLVTQFNSEGFNTAPHLSFGGDTEAEIINLLQAYRAAGVSRVVVLRGDMPSGIGGYSQMIYANELVDFIRKHFNDGFYLEVAAYPEVHPQAKNMRSDIFYLKKKFESGADGAITQYFYNIDGFLYFMDKCLAAGIHQPIVPGVMPINNFQNLLRFSANCGAEIPRWLQKAFEAYGDDAESLQALGIDVVTTLCQTLIENGVPGLHFYTMNQLEPTKTIVENLGLTSRS